jgi:hypothetical protein
MTLCRYHAAKAGVGLMLNSRTFGSGRPLVSGRLFVVALLFIAAMAAGGTEVATTGEARLRQSFLLRVGELTTVPEAGLRVELVALSYRSCPPDVFCDQPSGPVVDFRIIEIASSEELHRGELHRAPPSGYPFFVLPGDSDGRTYARFSVHSSEAWCTERADRRAERDCWSGLAKTTAKAEFCDRAASTGLAADRCYEELAEQMSDPALCQEVPSSRGWCRFQQVISNIENNVADCAVLLNWSLRTTCFRIAADELGSSSACSHMHSERARNECLQVTEDAQRKGLDRRHELLRKQSNYRVWPQEPRIHPVQFVVAVR